jgi:enoyl-CoA hydratase/carnithine racemase
VATDNVEVSREAGVLCLAIARPNKRNAITLPMFAALARELVAADRDSGVTAVLLCGSGAGFTAGHDLDDFDGWPQAADDPVPRFLHALAALRKPLVVAAHGWAVGIGATSMLHADWILAAPDTKIRFPFVDLGIAPEGASTLLLAGAVGTVRAKQLLLGGEVLTGLHAESLGLVTQVVAQEDLRNAAVERARVLGSKSPPTYSRIKSWLIDEAAIHARIDEEVAAINEAILARRASPVGGKTELSP